MMTSTIRKIQSKRGMWLTVVTGLHAVDTIYIVALYINTLSHTEHTDGVHSELIELIIVNVCQSALLLPIQTDDAIKPIKKAYLNEQNLFG